MIKTVFITGGGGFIGSHLIELLLDQKYKIIVLENSPTNTKRIEKFRSKIKIYFSEHNDIGKAFKENKIDCLIHLAARYIKNHSTVKEVEEIIDANVKLTSVLAELCIEHKVKLFINTGTFFEFKPDNKLLLENSPKIPYNLYAASKTASTEILKYYAYNTDLKVINYYLFAPFGDGDNEKLFAFLIRGLNNNDEIDFSGGEQRWNFTYVKDIASAYLAGIKNFSQIHDFEAFNVGYIKSFSIKEMTYKLEKISGKKFKINWGTKPYVKNEIMFTNCDNSKIMKMLKWRPKYDLDYGLRKTYEYYSERKEDGQSNIRNKRWSD